ncbi:MAG: B12-binding domain-containing radical SAM protein [Planctomycetes bacterium]|nr:B12-binding domain-containing radical SAM protein [Planctomycetota bacterium]
MARKRVVLFLPSRVDPSIGDLASPDLLPLELLHIAGPVEKLGYEVQVIDALVEPDYVRKVLAACDGALLFGASCILGYQVYDGSLVGRAVRQRFPRLPQVWGGWFPGSVPELYLRSGFCDAVAIGQGEVTFAELVQAVDHGADLERVAGLALWRDDALHLTARRAVAAMNDLPAPSFHLIDLRKYYDLAGRQAPYGRRVRNKLPNPLDVPPDQALRGLSYFTSFGCPEPCEFCCSPGVSGRRWVSLDADLLVDRLQEIHRRHPFDVLRIQDANFGVQEKRTARFCERLIESGMQLRWNATIEIKQVCQYADETIELLKRSGCHMLITGAEAASEETQRMIRKNIKEGWTDRAIGRMYRAGIQFAVTYIIGYPGESPASMYETIYEAAEMKTKYPTCSSEVFPYRPIPGSTYWEPSVQAGYPVPQDFEQWGRFFDYKFNSWWGKVPPDVQEAWKVFTTLAPWFDGNAGGRGPISRYLRKRAGHRLRNRLLHRPYEFSAYDLFRRVAGKRAARLI